MAADVEAVIAALRVVLEEAHKSEDNCCQAETANRWISQLPGSWTGRWKKLVLKGDAGGEVRREDFAGHVRAVIAFLEANRSQIPPPRTWWSLRRRTPAAQPGPTAPVAAPATARPPNLLRVRKPMPGVH